MPRRDPSVATHLRAACAEAPPNSFDPGTTVIEIGPQAENRELGEHLRRAAEQTIAG